jgi:hypothetical protein
MKIAEPLNAEQPVSLQSDQLQRVRRYDVRMPGREFYYPLFSPYRDTKGQVIGAIVIPNPFASKPATKVEARKHGAAGWSSAIIVSRRDAPGYLLRFTRGH